MRPASGRSFPFRRATTVRSDTANSDRKSRAANGCYGLPTTPGSHREHPGCLVVDSLLPGTGESKRQVLMCLSSLMQIVATWVQEKSQMIASASGSPMPNEPPMISATAKSKPSPARNSRHDMPLLPSSSLPANHLKSCSGRLRVNKSA